MCRVLVNREIERNAVQECVERLLFLFLPSCGTHGARGAFKGNRFRLYMVESASVSSIVFRRRCCCCCCSATRRLRGTRSPLAYPSASSPCRTHSTTPPCVLCYAQHTTFIQAYAYDVPPKTKDGRQQSPFLNRFGGPEKGRCCVV